MQLSVDCTLINRKSRKPHRYVISLLSVITTHGAYQDPEPGETAWLGPDVWADGSGKPPLGHRPCGAAQKGCGSLQGLPQELETSL